MADMNDDNATVDGPDGQQMRCDPQPVPFTWHIEPAGHAMLGNGESVPLLRLIFRHATGITVLHIAAPDLAAFCDQARGIAAGGLTIARTLDDNGGPR